MNPPSQKLRSVLRCRHRTAAIAKPFSVSLFLSISVVWINSSGAESGACLFINYQYTHTAGKHNGKTATHMCVVLLPLAVSAQVVEHALIVSIAEKLIERIVLVSERVEFASDGFGLAHCLLCFTQWLSNSITHDR
jgi:hypothetical protein